MTAATGTASAPRMTPVGQWVGVGGQWVGKRHLVVGEWVSGFIEKPTHAPLGHPPRTRQWVGAESVDNSPAEPPAHGKSSVETEGPSAPPRRRQKGGWGSFPGPVSGPAAPRGPRAAAGARHQARPRPASALPAPEMARPVRGVRHPRREHRPDSREHLRQPVRMAGRSAVHRGGAPGLAPSGWPGAGRRVWCATCSDWHRQRCPRLATCSPTGTGSGSRRSPARPSRRSRRNLRTLR